MAKIEPLLLDARLAAVEENLESRLGPVLEEVTPEALAIILVESIRITPLATPVVTYLFRRLRRLLKLRSA
jgi:hypothetical protein